ncbi:hypothetical protein M378DRAFT_163112 [Amanita muscaria Koide BX008]|uniref:Uncharacterized protein n=1 Tax=Amanita muscaria (strain Koide BX008) TaxID=946122 RepID=A0A0C2WSI1_AMAMK|nr:hypothetical protein M378DRAFT_163112 [Amanita muscaria Koide BX008]
MPSYLDTVTKKLWTVSGNGPRAQGLDEVVDGLFCRIPSPVFHCSFTAYLLMLHLGPFLMLSGELFVSCAFGIMCLVWRRG